MHARWMQIAREDRVLCGATAALFFAFTALRGQLWVDLAVSFGQAMALGLPFGLAFDLAFAVMPAAIVLLVRGSSRGLAWGMWALVAMTLWLVTSANVMYFSYFGTRLDRWVISDHMRDLPTIRRSVAQLFGNGLVITSVGAMLLALAALLAFAWRRRNPPVLGRSARRPDRIRGATLLAGAALLVAGDVALQARVLAARSILAEHVLVTLATEREPRVQLDPTDPRAPGRILAQLRDWDPNTMPAPVPAITPRADADGELVRSLAADPVATRELRARLGLPQDGPIHIVLLMLESTRAYELEHPELGPLVFPKTLAVVANHGIRFPVAYSSPITIAETVQGMLATQCSMLPNSGGTPAYIAHPQLRVRCLQAVAQEHGYRTVWISGGPKDFHNKFGFDSRHGTQEFYDETYFAKFPITNRFDECGYPDQPMLKQSVRLLEELARDERPVFATVLTLSTHHPVTEIAQGPIPDALDALLEPGNYRGYVSRLRYLDESLGEFFTDLFASPMGGRTLVVMLGDHGARYRPHLPTREHQRVELMARVPLAFITRDMPSPSVVTTPVHQVDVAPTIAEIAGFSGTVSWIGRSMWGGSGTPWILGDLDQLHYRAGATACYTHLGESRPRCFRLEDGQDPLFVGELALRDSDPDELAFIEAVGAAERQAIALDQVMPGENATSDFLLVDPPAPQYEIGAVMGDQVRLVGYDLDKAVVAPGETFTIAYYIEVSSDELDDNKLVVQLQSREEGVAFSMKLDHHPIDGLLPLRQLKKGQVIKDVQRVTVRRDFPLGAATIFWGLGQNEARVEIANPGAVSNHGGRRVAVATITIEEREAAPEPRAVATVFVESDHGDPAVIGCADGQREGFADVERHPRIAGCVARWDGQESLRAAVSGGACGDDVESSACAVPGDACAVGWQVCGTDGDVDDLRAHTSATACNEEAGPGRFVAAISHCPEERKCASVSERRLPCMEQGFCAEPVCCGEGCRSGNCRDGVWEGATRISIGMDEGCGGVTSVRNGGVLCCAE